MTQQQTTRGAGEFLIANRYGAAISRSYRWRWSDRFSGVLTACRYRVSGFQALRSEWREAFLATPKSALIADVPLEGGRALTVVNLHGLNFTPACLLAAQLEEIEKHLSGRVGPMLVCGDFNTWNGQRINVAQQFAARLGLSEVLPVHEDDSGTPSNLLILVNPVLDLFTDLDTDMTLDRVFCRGVDIVAAARLSEFTGSGVDHSPIRVDFRIRAAEALR